VAETLYALQHSCSASKTVKTGEAGVVCWHRLFHIFAVVWAKKLSYIRTAPWCEQFVSIAATSVVSV